MEGGGEGEVGSGGGGGGGGRGGVVVGAGEERGKFVLPFCTVLKQTTETVLEEKLISASAESHYWE